MRVLVDGLPRTVGGIGSLIINMAEYSRKSGKSDIVFEYIVAGRSGYETFLNEKGYKFYVAPDISNIIQYYAFLKSIFEKTHFDFLWFNNTSKVNIVLPLIAKNYGTKIISHPHGIDTEEKGIKRLVFKMLNRINRRRMFSLIDIPFACSKEAADLYYKGCKSLRERTQIMRNGIVIDDFRYDKDIRKNIRKRLSFDEDTILIGTVGRLTGVKNYPFIISLLKEISDEYKAIIIGDGEDREILQEMIDSNNLAERCFLLGKKENVSDFYSAMDCFLLPSFNEGMPYSIIEAQCEGLPCIVSDSLSKELKITDLVSYEPLSKPNNWLDKLYSFRRNQNRAIYPDRIRDAGYSIERSFEILMQSCGVE